MGTKKKLVKKKAAAVRPKLAAVKLQPVPTALMKLPQPPQVALSPVELHSQLQTSVTIVAQAQLLTVGDEPSLQQASTMLVQVKSAEKDLQAKRDLIVKPLKKHAELLDSLFKPGFERLEKADGLLRQKVLAYRAAAKVEAERLKSIELEKAEAAAKEGDHTTALAHAVEAENVFVPRRVMTAIEGTAEQAVNVDRAQVAAREVDDFEVVDLGKVPHEYFTFDSKKVRAAMRSGLTTIPGLRIFQKEQLAVGGR